jgi:hypothetical protein
MRKQFDIKYRPQIESGEYTVENRDGVHATILEWDIFIHGMAHMMLIRYDDKYEFVHSNGRINRTGQDCNLDLFIVTPEEELTEFEKAIKDMIKPYAAWPDDIFKEESAKLLFLAREQFIKDGYVIEKKAFHDAVEKVDPGIMKEVSKNVDMTEYEKGRADALKDLPRWNDSRWIYEDGWLQDGFLYYRNHSIPLKDLEKLPGFKED